MPGAPEEAEALAQDALALLKDGWLRDDTKRSSDNVLLAATGLAIMEHHDGQAGVFALA